MDQSEQSSPKGDNLLMQLVKQSKWKKAYSFLITPYGHEMARQQDEFDNTVLHVALGYRAPDDFLLKLIEIYPDAATIPGVDDWLCLHVAAMWGCSAQVMEALIRSFPQGLDIEALNSRTPRHYSNRFAHNKELLERPTAEWETMVRNKRQKSET
jgi:hypothetical protein